MNHTPGPWYVSRTPDRDEEGWVGPDVYDRDLGVFAILDGEPETIAQPWTEADAHLIAAAPELYEAIQAVDMALTGQKTSLEEWANTSRIVRAALAKVRGEDKCHEQP